VRKGGHGVQVVVAEGDAGDPRHPAPRKGGEGGNTKGNYEKSGGTPSRRALDGEALDRHKPGPAQPDHRAGHLAAGIMVSEHVAGWIVVSAVMRASRQLRC
jgi:hypothetical protein